MSLPGRSNLLCAGCHWVVIFFQVITVQVCSLSEAPWPAMQRDQDKLTRQLLAGTTTAKLLAMRKVNASSFQTLHVLQSYTCWLCLACAAAFGLLRKTYSSEVQKLARCRRKYRYLDPSLRPAYKSTSQ